MISGDFFNDGTKTEALPIEREDNTHYVGPQQLVSLPVLIHRILSSVTPCSSPEASCCWRERVCKATGGRGGWERKPVTSLFATQRARALILPISWARAIHLHLRRRPISSLGCFFGSRVHPFLVTTLSWVKMQTRTARQVAWLAQETWSGAYDICKWSIWNCNSSDFDSAQKEIKERTTGIERLHTSRWPTLQSCEW